MSLNGVIASFATGTYIVTRVAEGSYVDGKLVGSALVDELTVTAVDQVLDTITVVDHGLATGDGPFRLVPDDDVELPAPLDIATEYWAIRVDDDTLKLALSADDATGDVAIDLLDVGVGTWVLSTSRFRATMCIQPLRGKDLDAVPEADRTSDMRLVFIAEPLNTRMPGFEPDSVLYKAEDWTVITSEPWEHWGEGHWRATIGRDDET